MQSFRSWVRNAPEPVAYVLSDGTRILLGKGAKRYAAAEVSIKTKDPDSVDAVDKDGNVIRTYEFRSTSEGDDEDDEPTASAPKLPASSTDASLLIHFSTLLAKAYAQGASDHAAAYAKAHEQVVSLCNSVLQQNVGLQKLLNQMLKDVRADAIEAREQLEDVLEERREAAETPPPPPGGPSSLIEKIVASRVAAAVQGSAPAAGGDK